MKFPVVNLVHQLLVFFDAVIDCGFELEQTFSEMGEVLRFRCHTLTLRAL